MRCANFQLRFHRLLDERQLPQQDPALQAHARHCGACGELLSGHERLVQGLQGPGRGLSPDFAERTVAAWFRQRSDSSCDASDHAPWTVPAAMPPARPEPARAAQSFWRWGRRWRQAGWPLVAALGLFLMLVPWAYQRAERRGPERSWADRHPAPGERGRRASPGTLLGWLPGGRRVAGPRAVPAPDSVPAPQSVDPAFPSSEAPAPPSQLANAGLPPVAPEFGKELSSDELRLLLVEMWTSFPQIPPAPRTPIDRLAGGIRPLTSTLAGAWDALRRSFPVPMGDNDSGQASPPIRPSLGSPA
ncbi:MAG: hypothetical protein AB7F89_05195 [Pirellulaceae bacterium]